MSLIFDREMAPKKGRLGLEEELIGEAINSKDF